MTEPLSFSFVSLPESQAVIIHERQFRDSGLGSLVGFYDWLHSSGGRLVGVRTRILAAPGVADILAALAANSAVEIVEGNVNVYFAAERGFDEAESYHLESGENRILVGPNGLLALTYDTIHLSDADASAIRRLVVGNE